MKPTLYFVGYEEDEVKIIVKKETINNKLVLVDSEGRTHDYGFPVDLNKYIDSFPGTYFHANAVDKFQAFDFVKENWQSHYMYYIGDPLNRKFTEGLRSLDHLPPKMLIGKYHKDWYKHLDDRVGVLCWVGKDETEVFERKRISLVKRTYNGALRSLGGSPDIRHVGNFNDHKEAQPLTIHEMRYFLTHSPKSFEQCIRPNPTSFDDLLKYKSSILNKVDGIIADLNYLSGNSKEEIISAISKIKEAVA